jgi:hypothetical protein
MSPVDDMYFAMAFFFGFTPAQVDDMDIDRANRLLKGLEKNKEGAGMRALSKMMGV